MKNTGKAQKSLTKQKKENKQEYTQEKNKQYKLEVGWKGSL